MFIVKCELARGLGAPGLQGLCGVVRNRGLLSATLPEKSPGLLVHAAAIILAARPLARVVFVGDGAARHMCEELARAYGIENRVIFVGAVYGAENVASYYASFDVVVQPALRAWSETFCIANLEAMASARPIVSFGVGGVGEYFVAAPTRDTCDAAPDHRGCTPPNRRRASPWTARRRKRWPGGPARASRTRAGATRSAARRGARGGVLHRGFLAKYAVLYSRLHRGEDLSDLPFVITW